MSAIVQQSTQESAARAFWNGKMQEHPNLAGAKESRVKSSSRPAVIVFIGCTVVWIISLSSPYRQWGLVVFLPCILIYGAFDAITKIGSAQSAVRALPYLITASLILSPLLVFSTGTVQGVAWIVTGGLLGLMTLHALVVSAIKTFPRRTGKELEKIQQKVAAMPVEEPAKPRCTICKEESQYEVCLTCEKAFQGERHRVRAQILRAKQAGTPATLTLVEWLEQLQTFHSRCAYCHKPFQCIEHYIPITQGGGTTKENCVPACFTCNAKKSGKHPEK